MFCALSFHEKTVVEEHLLLLYLVSGWLLTLKRKKIKFETAGSDGILFEKRTQPTPRPARYTRVVSRKLLDTQHVGVG